MKAVRKMIIMFPIDRVIGDIVPDAVQFLFIPDDMIVKTGLPGEGDIVQCGIFFDPGFESADNGGQVLGLRAELVGCWLRAG